MPLPALPYDESDLREDDRDATIEARLHRTQEALADQMIERRWDQERIATLRLQVQELEETVAALRRALDAAKAEPKTQGRQARRLSR